MLTEYDIRRKSNVSLCWCCGLIVVVGLVACLSAGPSISGPDRAKLLTEAKDALAKADPVMGDWEGSWTLDDGADSGFLAAQVIALGNEGYAANIRREWDQPGPALIVLKGEAERGKVRLVGKTTLEDSGSELELQATVDAKVFKGQFTGETPAGESFAGTFEMDKTYRLSPTLGAKPPKNAAVLFNGKDFDQWQRMGGGSDSSKVGWKLVDGAMEVKPRAGSIITKRKFGDCRLHVEFRTPFMPDARGQGRGNSGVYLQGRHEVQVLDSYGLKGMDNECGGIYRVAKPKVNMCAPPTQWQTYDITFRAARFDADGKKTEDARLTVVHNGVEIHHDVPVPGPTTAAPSRDEKGRGGIYLQDHGNPVQYRNIWLVELPGEADR